jgi:hypothetical protein
MIGHRVEWLHRDDSGRPTVDLVGEVVAVERGGSPATWSALVLRDDGIMMVADPTNLRVLSLSERLVPASREPEQMIEAGREAIRALEFLEKHLDSAFPDTNAGGRPVEHAISLLDGLKAELIEVGAERDRLRAKRSKKDPQGSDA